MAQKIVVIEDEAEILKMVSEFLLESGYACYGALNAPDGLALVKKELPSLVLLDIGLPGMNGLEVLEKIRRDYPETSVLILSGHQETEIVKRALTAGASEYITKPIQLETLLNHFIKELIGPPR
ncbi:MAG: Transcriptional regulatory protein WalR [Candidatus Omnitrophica bacterium ADurb.Bin277]|nr:MAG: Transcriptional regulatory protein WalR [Candidatus Omnitrophica bacterium ADurb.Bin277]